MKILIAGDYCPLHRVAEFFNKDEYASVLSDVRQIVSEADYSIVNFECPVVNGSGKPIYKLGPNLRCSTQGVLAMKWAGFDCATLANNHFLDFGAEGVQETLDTLDKYGIDHVGGGMNLQAASQILYKDINGQRLAIVNCCEHEFSIATETTAGCNPLNPVKQYYAIKEAKENSDYVLVIVHGGHEHYQLPSVRMVETYRFFIDVGADAVVNHHQHCYSGYEIYEKKPIVYGLGNFCFDEGRKESNLWHEGYLVEICFGKSISLNICPYTQCADNPSVELMLDRTTFDKSLERLNEIIANNVILKNKQDNYYNQSDLACRAIFDPVNLRYIKGCQRRGWLPFFYSRKYLTKIFNYIICESHRDKLIHILQNKL